MHNWIIQAKLWNGIKFPQIPAHFYTGCWLWQGPTVPGGHGQFKHKGRSYIASRVAYEVSIGQILPDDLVVRHRCPDEPHPACCNPVHLTSGTAMDNVIDRMVARRSAVGMRNGAYTKPDRRRSGENHGMAKFDDATVILLRAMYRVYDGYGFCSFWARKLGMTKTNVSRVARGELWDHVQVPADYAIDPAIVLEMQTDIELHKKLKGDKIRAVRMKEYAEGRGVFANPNFTHKQ